MIYISNYKIRTNSSTTYYNGSKWKSNASGDFIILNKLEKYYLAKNGNKHYNYYLCEFEDGTIVEAEYKAIANGKVKNPNYPSVYGIGYLGEGIWRSGNAINKTQEYETWKKMLQRCYDDKYQERQPTYKGVTVEKRWHSFQNFCQDIQLLKGYEEWKDKKRFELDKDILCEELGVHPKIYSINTCQFVSEKENRSGEHTGALTGLTYIAQRVSDGYKEEFTNQTAFAEKWSLSSKSVNKVVKGNTKTHRGWKFKIKGEVV